MIKLIHRISLAVGLFVLIHRGVFGADYPVWLLFGLLLATLSLSAACGIFIIRTHREDGTFLPPIDYVTYGMSALAWSYCVMSSTHDLLHARHLAHWLGVALPWIMFVGPWLAFRRHKPTPMVIDTTFVITGTLMANAAVTSVHNLPSAEQLATYGYLILPGPIAVIAYLLYRLKKAGIPELPVALAIGALLVPLAPGGFVR